MTTKKFPKLTTERLTMRKIVASDYSVVLFLRSDKAVNKFIERPPQRQTKNRTDAVEHIQKLNREFEENTSVSWGITLLDNHEIIGSICLWNYSQDLKTAEVGYELHPEFQKKGIMSEALNCVIEFGFSKMKFNSVEAFTHIENDPSKTLLKRNGFQLNINRSDANNLFNVVFEITRNA